MKLYFVHKVVISKRKKIIVAKKNGIKESYNIL